MLAGGEGFAPVRCDDFHPEGRLVHRHHANTVDEAHAFDGPALLNVVEDQIELPPHHGLKGLVVDGANGGAFLAPAHRHACRNETRELIAFDQEVAAEPFLKPFATASRRVGQAQIKRLRPLRDVRVVQRYLHAVENGAAHGWHTVVYGVTLGVYSLPVLQGVLSYERQTLLGFMHAVSRSLRLSEQDCRNLLEELSPSLPESSDAILGDDELPRLPKQNF